MDTRQPAVARLERGDANAKLATLVKLAEALDATVRIELDPVEMIDEPRRPRWWEREAPAVTPGEATALIDAAPANLMLAFAGNTFISNTIIVAGGGTLPLEMLQAAGEHAGQAGVPFSAFSELAWHHRVGPGSEAGE